MFWRTLRALSCLLLGAASMLAIPPSSPKDEGVTTSSGCVRAGVEAGCLILKDFKVNKTYSLHFPAKKPDLDTAISFEGKEGGADTCMQGIVVNVTKWTPLKMKCPPAAKSSATGAEGKCSDWKAWHDRQPGHTATLHVTGKCTFPTGGYSVKLRPAAPQGINPAIYILDRMVHRPTGPATDVITEVPVHYSEKTSTHYTSVQIRPDGVVVPVKEIQ